MRRVATIDDAHAREYPAGRVDHQTAHHAVGVVEDDLSEVVRRPPFGFHSCGTRVTVVLTTDASYIGVAGCDGAERKPALRVGAKDGITAAEAGEPRPPLAGEPDRTHDLDPRVADRSSRPVHHLTAQS